MCYTNDSKRSVVERRDVTLRDWPDPVGRRIRKSQESLRIDAAVEAVRRIPLTGLTWPPGKYARTLDIRCLCLVCIAVELNLGHESLRAVQVLKARPRSTQSMIRDDEKKSTNMGRACLCAEDGHRRSSDSALAFAVRRAREASAGRCATVPSGASPVLTVARRRPCGTRA